MSEAKHTPFVAYSLTEGRDKDGRLYLVLGIEATQGQIDEILKKMQEEGTKLIVSSNPDGNKVLIESPCL